MAEPAATTESPAPTTELFVSGMTCGNCARHVTEAIQSVPGVRAANVSLDAHQASVRWADGSPADAAAVVKAVEAAGYGAKVLEAHEHGAHEHETAGWQLTLWVGLAGTAVLMIGEWVFHLAMTPWFRWFAFGVAGVVQVFSGRPFYAGAWRQLKVRSSNMDTLVALGSTTAFAYSTWALLGGYGGHLYFMEAAAIISLISAGHWMEARVSSRASSALRKLLDLAPQKARKLVKVEVRSAKGDPRMPSPFSLLTSDFKASAAEKEIEVPVAALKPGDLVALRPGDRVPVDGDVVDGDSAVDESMLTGESIPVDKTAGRPLYAGTVVINGRLVLRVTATGESTALAQIIAAVQRAQTSRANIQRLGDRVSNVFVPVVVAIAVVSALWWGLAYDSAAAAHERLAPFLWHAHPPSAALTAAFIIAAAVLIVACPCAMGLATPAAIMAGSNAAAERGILIRDGVALEKAGEVTTVLFDKTGTLTVGRPELMGVWEDPRFSPGNAKSLAVALARHSNHPISKAIATLPEPPVEIMNWKEVRGTGIEGQWQSADGVLQPVRLGRVTWLKKTGADLCDGESFLRQHWANATVVGLAVGDSVAALFVIKDALKPGAAKVVAELHRQGLKVCLVTGDNAISAWAIAEQAGIPSLQVFADVRPEEKASLVQNLQREGHRVAFVGDGINDAPALEQADLGIAVSRASDVAREAADLILLRSDIEAVPEALGLSRATLRTIKQNLFWAFFYNSLGVPLAALGFLSPVLCAAAMGVSDLIVIGNALRLRRWRR